MSGWGRIFGRAFTQVAMRQARRSLRQSQRQEQRQRQRPQGQPQGTVPPPTGGQGSSGAAQYAPQDNGQADPGEVVWAWVPFEEDASQGKDRPVLIVGRQGADLFGLQLTSKDHDRDAAQEERAGRLWMDVGAGAWDREGRPSEVRINRLIRLDSGSVRREGAALDKGTYDQVVAAARQHLDW